MAVDDSVIKLLLDIHKSQEDLIKDISEVKVLATSKPCEKNENRLKLLERIVFGLVAYILFSFFQSTEGNINKQAAIVNKAQASSGQTAVKRERVKNSE